MICPRCGGDVSIGHLRLPTVIVCDRCGGILKIVDQQTARILDPRDLAAELEAIRKSRMKDGGR